MKYFILTSILIFSFVASKSQVDDSVKPDKEWQKAICAKEKKDVLDYYLLLSPGFFSCEVTAEDSEDFRLNQITHKNQKNGFIMAKSEGNPLQLALFKDKVNMKDILVVDVYCGAGCMCGNTEFLEFDATSKTWKNAEVIDWKEVEKRINIIQQNTGKEVFTKLVLPEFGTVIKVVDGESESEKLLYELVWEKDKFVIK